MLFNKIKNIFSSKSKKTGFTYTLKFSFFISLCFFFFPCLSQEKKLPIPVTKQPDTNYMYDVPAKNSDTTISNLKEEKRKPRTTPDNGKSKNNEATQVTKSNSKEKKLSENNSPVKKEEKIPEVLIISKPE